MTSPNGNIFRVIGPLCGEFTGPRWIPHTKASDAELWCFFDLRLNKRLSKQSWGWWFETLSHPLWRHRNGNLYYLPRPTGANTVIHADQITTDWHKILLEWGWKRKKNKFFCWRSSTNMILPKSNTHISTEMVYLYHFNFFIYIIRIYICIKYLSEHK